MVADTRAGHKGTEVIACRLVAAEPSEVGENRVTGALRRFTLCGRRNQALLEAFVERMDDIPFEDRVLGFVVPCLCPQIAQFHETGAPELADLFPVEALSRLDFALAKRLDEFVERIHRIGGTGCASSESGIADSEAPGAFLANHGLQEQGSAER